MYIILLLVHDIIRMIVGFRRRREVVSSLRILLLGSYKCFSMQAVLGVSSNTRKTYSQSTPSNNPSQIFVKLKKTIAVDVNASDSIWEVKRRIQDREGYSPKQLRRVYHRKVLADEKLLREYDAREHTACEFMRKS